MLGVGPVNPVWRKARVFVGVLALLSGMLPHQPATAQRTVSLIRDAEIEDTIRAYAAPVFAAAGLESASVSVHLIGDPALNAFVAGGQRIFVHTGLLMSGETPAQVIGVLAHETGHIAAGHLARAHDAMRGAAAAMIAAMVLGAVAVAAGAGDAGVAAVIGGSSMAERGFLAFSRTQEASADQAALSYLERTQQSARGLVEVLQKLGDQEALQSSRQDPYIRSHPLSRDRMNFIEGHIARSPYSDAPPRPEFVERHARMRAKLFGFLDPPARTLRRYPEGDVSLPARYARAIAHHRAGRTAEALAEIDALVAAHPGDPYFHELRGQIRMESGDPKGAVPDYREARRLAPKSALLASDLGKVLIATEDDANIKAAVEHLVFATRGDPTDPQAWYHLSVAQGRTGEIGLANLASAERALLQGQYVQAREMARRAMGRLSEGSPGWLRAQDLEGEAIRLRQNQQQGR
ncbi:MAG: tetratricopeptide repeat protein [Alphaproteobacteria bacterium]|nr:tetratricopeptide repeat protein [Alphaproteobacteria bacterium]